MNTAVRSTSHPGLLRRMALGVAIAVGLLAPGASLASAVTPTSADRAATMTPYCGIVWGSLPESATSGTARGTLYDVRAGRHACFDRLVFDVHGPIAGYRVQYVDAVRAPGSGAVVGVAGRARLEIRIEVPAHDTAGRATYRPASHSRLVDVRGWDTFRQVAWAGSFEGSTTVALGVRARLPMRVFVLPGADRSRLVVDVAHYWF